MDKVFFATVQQQFRVVYQIQAWKILLKLIFLLHQKKRPITTELTPHIPRTVLKISTCMCAFFTTPENTGFRGRFSTGGQCTPVLCVYSW